MKKEDHIAYWNEAATGYCSRRDEMSLIYRPVVDELVGNVSGKRVLDAGCGDGESARTFAALGAAVTGIDGSEKMISLAKTATGPTNVHYEICDLTERLPFADNRYDVVLADMVLMDIPTIDVAIAEFFRVLSDVGILVFSITHPCFFCSEWVLGENGERLHKAVSDYLTPRREELNFWGKTLHFHRPLSYYFAVLSRNGFCIEAFREPVPSDAALREHPGWDYHERVPSFVVMKASVKRPILANEQG